MRFFRSCWIVLGAAGIGTVGSGRVDAQSPPSTLSSVASFNATTGLNPGTAVALMDAPVAGLTIDSSGNLYGTTSEGGLNGGGSVYEVAASSLNPTHPVANGATITTLANLDTGGGATTFGIFPNAPLAFDSHGNLFDTAQFGGTYPNNGGGGSVFELSSASQANPQLPNTTAAGSFTFQNVPNGSRFDPPSPSSFTYAKLTQGAPFTRIEGFPTGFQWVTVSVGSNVLGRFSAGQSPSFPGNGVSSFTVSGTNPVVDFANTAAFPLKSGFNQRFASFSMVARPARVPEPASIVTGGMGLFWVLVFARRRRKVRR